MKSSIAANQRTPYLRSKRGVFSLFIHTSMDAACLAQAQMICPARREEIVEKSHLRRQFRSSGTDNSGGDSQAGLHLLF